MYKKVCITNRTMTQGSFLEKMESICCLPVESRPDYIILREKDLSGDEYLELAEQMMDGMHALEMRDRDLVLPGLILHNFPDVARKLDYPRIHLSMQDFLALSEEEKSWFRVIGVSTHSLEEAIKAEEEGAAYITASHIFPTACKEGLAPRGLSYLRQVSQAVSIPVYALGGIHPENIHICIEAGADGICMMSEYMKD